MINQLLRLAIKPSYSFFEMIFITFVVSRYFSINNPSAWMDVFWPALLGVVFLRLAQKMLLELIDPEYNKDKIITEIKMMELSKDSVYVFVVDPKQMSNEGVDELQSALVDMDVKNVAVMVNDPEKSFNVIQIEPEKDDNGKEA